MRRVLADQKPDPIRHLDTLPERERMDLLNFIKVSADPLAKDEVRYLKDVMLLKTAEHPERSN